jgi:amidophosphoribosyltransferase
VLFRSRDPNGIRPAYYYCDDEVVVVASERSAIQTSFDLHYTQIKEIKPGHALIVKKNGKVSELPFAEPKEQKSCSFERVYFSRGTDRDIYTERKKLGELLAKPILEAINYDFENSVFAFVPNTAESAFFGLREGLVSELNIIKREQILKLGKKADTENVDKILNSTLRIEKLVVKDVKQRTFIADEASRSDMVAHVYDVTYGIVNNDTDTLVLLDDSIVRGTTLRDSIIAITARLKPKKILVVSSAPQIRYPDCYGIDMSKMGEFVAFQALVKLLERDNKMDLLHAAYEKSKAQEKLPTDQIENVLQTIYKLYSNEEISKEIAKIVTPPNIIPQIEVIYQTIEGLHLACPNHKGDWYFSGNYPTPGGNRVVNRAFINYMEKKNVRAY